MPTNALAIVLSLASLAGSPPTRQESRPAPPSDAEFASLTRAAERQFEVRRAKTLEQKVELAQRLRGEADALRDAPRDRYVVLALTYETALEALDARLALEVAALLQGEYVSVDGNALEVRALAEVGGDRRLPAERFGDVARRVLARAEQSLALLHVDEAKGSRPAPPPRRALLERLTHQGPGFGSPAEPPVHLASAREGSRGFEAVPSGILPGQAAS